MTAFDWSPSQKPGIAEHSRAKLAIYNSYIKNYIRERVIVGMDRFRFNVVDGFCGGGSYQDGGQDTVLGSPLIILEAVRQAEIELNVGRQKHLSIEMNLYCFDQSQDAINSLRATLIDEGYEDRIDKSIFLKRANFSQIAKRLVGQLTQVSGKTIFVLDQKGFAAVSFDTLRAIFMQLDRPEVILTFGYEWLTSFVSRYEDVCRRFNDLAIQPPSEADYMAAVGGKHGVSRFIQKHLIDAFRAIAPFFTPFFVTSRHDGALRGSNLKYWLVHLSAHERANDVMKGVHWSVGTHSAHFLGPGLDMMGYDPWKVGSTEHPYLFGDEDAQLTQTSLLDDIPRFVTDHNGWMTAGALWEATCNETPSTSAMQGEALRSLAKFNELDLLGPSGGIKRGGPVRRTDILRLKPQKSFSFMGRLAG